MKNLLGNLKQMNLN